VKSEWKNTETWKAKGKAMDTNTGGSPGTRASRIAYRNSPSEEVKPMDQWMDGFRETDQ